MSLNSRDVLQNGSEVVRNSAAMEIWDEGTDHHEYLYTSGRPKVVLKQLWQTIEYRLLLSTMNIGCSFDHKVFLVKEITFREESPSHQMHTHKWIVPGVVAAVFSGKSRFSGTSGVADVVANSFIFAGGLDSPCLISKGDSMG